MPAQLLWSRGAGRGHDNLKYQLRGLNERERPDVTTATAAEETTWLILGVARLGEADLTGWWGSHGLDRAGRYVLGRMFRRTWRSAALEIDMETAARRHDDATAGRRTALHLFSAELPFRRWAEAWLAEQKTATEPSPIFDELAAWDLGTARATIARWAGSVVDAEVVGDALRVGDFASADATDPVALAAAARKLAGAYLMIDGPFRVPYFDLAG